MLGHWALTAEGLDEAGADETMLDLFRWHAAEEVEHRALVYDVYQHVGRQLRPPGGHDARHHDRPPARVGGRRAVYFLRHDPALEGPRRPGPLAYLKAVRRGRVPGIGTLLASVPRYLRRDHHPSDEGDAELALAYLRRSPAVAAWAA